MIENTNMVCKLIKSPAYVSTWKPTMPTTERKNTYTLYNQYAPLMNRVVITTDGKTAEISVMNYMNSVYYEHLNLANKRDANRFVRINNIVFMKNMIAMQKHIQTHFTDTPHR